MSRPETITSEYVRGFRAGESSALERAARQFETWAAAPNTPHETVVTFSYAAYKVRSMMKSPAAAPAAEPTREQLRADLERAAPGADELAVELRKQFRIDPATEYDKHVVARSASIPPSEPAAPPARHTAAEEAAMQEYFKPVTPSLLPRVLAALESVGSVPSDAPRVKECRALAAELRRYIAEMEAGHAEAPDAERDRNRHNAMLVEAWREEFSTLCKVLFPGNAGPIGWKHVQAKIAEREKRIAELERAYRAYAEWATSEFGARAWQSGESYTEWQTRLAASEKPAP